MLDSDSIKKDFPILRRKINGKPLVYLDNAATTQKPKPVIDSLKNFYENHNANVHRGIHTLSEEATEMYESARKKTASFINAKESAEIIFLRNCTEAINLVAYSFGEQHIQKNDEIILSPLEHHSNLVPWQELAKRKNARLKFIPLKSDYTLDLEEYEKMLNNKTKFVAVTAMSNVLGLCPDIKRITKAAHQKNAKVLIDGAQYAAHMKTDVQKIGCDFFTMSSHKMLGPTGLGVLYAKKEILKEMPPFIFGGDMVKTVDLYKADYNLPPWKFEAGTPNIADAIAFAEALEYLKKTGLKNIREHDKKLVKYAAEKFSKYEKVKVYLPKKDFSSILSFTVEGVHPHDVASIFNEEGIAVRAGLHCAEPLHRALNIPSTARLSFYLYNTEKDVDRCELALKKTLNIFKI